MKYVSIVPSYEPNTKLIDVVNELKKNKFDIVIVNDGSDEVYDVMFNKCKDKCKYIKYNENRGKGYAIKKALKYIKENYDDCVIVTIDSDGQHKVKDAIKLCDKVKLLDNTIVLGKRHRNKKTPLRSKIGNNLIKNIFKSRTGIELYDTQTGLRAFKYSMINFLLNVDGNRYDYEMNVLIKSVKNDIKLIEVPIETIYIDNNSGSHYRTIKDSFKILKIFFKRK